MVFMCFIFVCFILLVLHSHLFFFFSLIFLFFYFILQKRYYFNFYYIIIIQNSYIYIILIILIYNINYNKSTFILIHFLKIVLSSLLWILFAFLWLSYFNQFIESFEQTSFIMYNILFYNYFIKLLFLKKS